MTQQARQSTAWGPLCLWVVAGALTAVGLLHLASGAGLLALTAGSGLAALLIWAGGRRPECWAVLFGLAVGPGMVLWASRNLLCLSGPESVCPDVIFDGTPWLAALLILGAAGPLGAVLTRRRRRVRQPHG